jgi:hypothetical protein
MFHLLNLAWSLSVRLTCWLSRRRVVAIDKARWCEAGTVTFSSAHPWLGGTKDDDDWLEPVEDWAGRERRYDA